MSWCLRRAVDTPAPLRASAIRVIAICLAGAIVTTGCGESLATKRAKTLRTILSARQTFVECTSSGPGCTAGDRTPVQLLSSAKGDTVAILYRDNHIEVWDLARPRRLLRTDALPDNGINSATMLLSPDGRRVLRAIGDTKNINVQVVDEWSTRGPPRPIRYLISYLTFPEAIDASGQAFVLAPYPRNDAVEIFAAIQPDTKQVRQAIVPGQINPRYGGFDARRGWFVLASDNVLGGYFTWHPGAPAHLFPLDCGGAGFALSADASLFACNTRATSTAPIGEVSVWNVEKDARVAHWPAGPVLLGPKVASDAVFLQHGRALALVVSQPQHGRFIDRLMIYRVADHSVIASARLGPGSAGGTMLWSADDVLIADSIVASASRRSLHRLRIIPVP